MSSHKNKTKISPKQTIQQNPLPITVFVENLLSPSADSLQLLLLHVLTVAGTDEKNCMSTHKITFENPSFKYLSMIPFFLKPLLEWHKVNVIIYQLQEK